MTEPALPHAAGAPKPPAGSRAGAMAGWLILAAGLVIVYVLFAAGAKPTDPDSFGRFSTGGLDKLTVLADPPPQPAGPLRDPQGRETTLAAYRGEVLVVNLWASWCEPCEKEMPSLAALNAAFAGRGARVVAVSVDKPNTAETARRRLADWSGGGLGFYHDPTMAALYDARSPGLPTTIVYDRRGRELARLGGEADWNSPEAHALIEAALAW